MNAKLSTSTPVGRDPRPSGLGPRPTGVLVESLAFIIYRRKYTPSITFSHCHPIEDGERIKKVVFDFVPITLIIGVK